MNTITPLIDERQIYSVSELNQEARDLLETNFFSIWVSGEISNFARPASGHCYFSLKDAQAQIRCAYFRNQRQKLDFVPSDGLQVLVKARVSLYTNRGDFQLIVEHMEAAGDGALRRAFELLKNRLAAEGLFDSIHKKPLPRFPSTIGVVTSATGAALRDILSVLKRRAPNIPLIIYPTAVQGEAAADQIVAALTLANRHAACDVIILARGGGSLEDLWPFNEERVARAVHASIIPIVSGVGHEVDISIVDFVADQRAATPTAAAELTTPNNEQWLQHLSQLQNRLQHLIQQCLRHQQQTLLNLKQRLRHPGQKLRDQIQFLDALEQRLLRAQQNLLKHKTLQLQHIETRLKSCSPQQRISLLKEKIILLQNRLNTLLSNQHEHAKSKLAQLSRALEAVSPLATLNRGYAIVKNADGSIIENSTQVTIDEIINVQLRDGLLVSIVKEINKE